MHPQKCEGLTFKNVTKKFGNTVVFDNVSLHIKGTGVTVLMGESGRGKTTLLSLILGLIKPDSGSITHAYQRIACAFQEPRLLPDRTAIENVTYVLHGKNRQDKQQLAKSMLQKLGIADACDKYPAELSGGMQQRVSLARALLYGGDLLILDEPFRGLDKANKEIVLDLIRESSQKCPVLLVSHDDADAKLLEADLILL